MKTNPFYAYSFHEDFNEICVLPSLKRLYQEYIRFARLSREEEEEYIFGFAHGEDEQRFLVKYLGPIVNLLLMR